MNSTSTDLKNVTARLARSEKLEGWNRPPVIEVEGDSELLELAMGPHHPSTHGVFRMDVVLDGERVIRLKPVFGYLHRNHEQLEPYLDPAATMAEVQPYRSILASQRRPPDDSLVAVIGIVSNHGTAT